MVREIDSDSCDALIRLVLPGSDNALPCQVLGDGKCLRDTLAESGLQGIRIVWGNCSADIAEGVPRRKLSPLQKVIKGVMASVADREAEDPVAAELLKYFKAGVIAIAGAPEKTADALRNEIKTSEPKTNRFVAAVVEKVKLRMLTSFRFVTPDISNEPPVQDLMKAVSGGSQIVMVMGLAVEPDNIIQYAEMLSTADNAQRENSQQIPWDGLREVRESMKRDRLGAGVLSDLIKEFEHPGSKFRTPIFGSTPEKREIVGALGVGMLYQAYLAVGVNAGLARPPRRR